MTLYPCEHCGEQSRAVVTFIIERNGECIAEYDACKDRWDCIRGAKQKARDRWKQARAA